MDFYSEVIDQIIKSCMFYYIISNIEVNVPANIQMETFESKGRSADFPDRVSDLEYVAGLSPGVMS